ncbi:hypothetical protein FKM82_002284 [Ascaphus truei]
MNSDGSLRRRTKQPKKKAQECTKGDTIIEPCRETEETSIRTKAEKPLQKEEEKRRKKKKKEGGEEKDSYGTAFTQGCSSSSSRTGHRVE